MFMPIWTSPELTSIGREPMLNFVHENVISLDGKWRFQLLTHPDAPLSDQWSSIPVPGLWTLQNDPANPDAFWDKPIYTNIQMPFDELPPQVPVQNPTGIYEREFELPEEWSGKRIVVQIGGFESVAVLSVNGTEVGVAKDSRLASDFDVTAHIQPGTNTITWKIIKWSDATFIEDQDEWWHGGITRSIKIFATPDVHIQRFYLTPGLKSDLKTGTFNVRAFIASASNQEISNHTLRISFHDLHENELSSGEQKLLQKRTDLSDEENATRLKYGRAFFLGNYWNGKQPSAAKPILKELALRLPGEIFIEGEIPNIQPWSAESPRLYKILVELINPDGKVIERFNLKTGFRDVKISGGELRVNGAPIIIYGINRHDFHPVTGRVLSPAEIREDLLALKRFNFNAIRTSHYPNDIALLELADELGFYVVEEANIESHAFQESICNDPRYLNAFVSRVSRMIERDISHPSVIMWSLGNESGAGLNHEAAAAYARSFDPTRPLHYEGAIRDGWLKNYSLTDVVCPMYPDIDSIVEYAKSPGRVRPLIMCEYSHAMGNSNGNLKEYWQAIHKYKGLQGGFIWEMWDHGIEQQLGNGKTRSAYGGDFGETRHDGSFCCDGMFWPDRTPKPAMYEMQAIASPIEIKRASKNSAEFSAFNRNFFIDASQYLILWNITVEGDVIDSGEVALKNVAPRTNKKFIIKSKSLNKPGTYLTFSIVNVNQTPWSHEGHEIGFAQFSTPANKVASETIPTFNAEKYISEQGEITLPFFVVPPSLTIFRAPTENDIYGWINKKWSEHSLAHLTRSFEVVNNKKTSIIDNVWTTQTGFRVTHRQKIEAIDSGFRITESVKLPPALKDLPRVGTTFQIDSSFQNYSFFGAGPHETYPDRSLAKIGKYQSTISEQYVPYVVPQESGGHAQVTWCEFNNAAGQIINLRFDKPRQVSAIPYTSAELALSTHADELPDSDKIVVTVDAKHRGIGSASCGPDTLPEYLLNEKQYTWSWEITYH